MPARFNDCCADGDTYAIVGDAHASAISALSNVKIEAAVAIAAPLGVVDFDVVAAGDGGRISCGVISILTRA